MSEQPSSIRVASVVASVNSGGIGPVCRYAAEGMVRALGWQVTLVCLHDSVGDYREGNSGLRVVALGLDLDCSGPFLEWLANNPQDLLITSDVSRIEATYSFLPATTRHVVQIHDSGRKYLDVAIRHQRVIDGVLCVARNVENKLRGPLENSGFKGLIGTVCNGADFPAQVPRRIREGPLRLLFMGNLDPMIKGIFDLVPIMHRLNQIGVTVILTVAGGRNGELERRFKRRGLDHLVTWAGRVPHAECYRLAAESDLLLMTSRREPFGMVTIEAMSMGCVPLAYDIPSGSREIIEHEKSGLLLPLGDFNAWGESIRSFHENRQHLHEMSQAATLRARTQFNSEKLVGATADFLQAVQLNSRIHPPQRLAGEPAFNASKSPKISYSRLPHWFRERARNVVGGNPYLSWWWLNR